MTQAISGSNSGSITYPPRLGWRDKDFSPWLVQVLLFWSRSLLFWRRCYGKWSRPLLFWCRCYGKWHRCLLFWSRCYGKWRRCDFGWGTCAIAARRMAFCGAGIGYKNAPAPKMREPAPLGLGLAPNKPGDVVFGNGVRQKWEWSVFQSGTVPGNIAPEPTPWPFSREWSPHPKSNRSQMASRPSPLRNRGQACLLAAL